MVIGVSACLLGENCKYSGGNNYSESAIEYIKGHEVVSICPEVLGGLPIPRDPAEIVDGVVKHKDGSSVDKEFRDGAKKALEILKDTGAELVILQSRSPSCGVNTIYDGTFSGKLISGNGVFVELLKAEGFNVIDVEEL
ncbi:Uncharacterized conserved protein YbbK, DUF523 family [Pseudobutyrivibrio sp. ACV-2]|uniref:DUF523 domain-containing protein n=1 Tax=Pseudobutyrivibrio sp. ACV-2 TaxID=1520801 RepID=UPI00089AD22B|nr:DUF523 domain-containing protein [Pseudobutyrivibrio sp. ACV-2]SEA92453.1 Uncharacterized conserved protein YbbK, DUF523 family [Pseudobutyrivibrio sp. ACV-2]